MTTPLLRVEGLDVAYRVAGADLMALNDVAFDIKPGEILGLVGESGSGKSTVAAALLRILARNGRITRGAVEFSGRDLTTLSEDRMRRIRGAEIAMIFQDPLGSLNPTMTVGRQLLHVAASHPDRVENSAHGAVRRRILELLAQVGIPDPVHRFDDYPHQFSGGMRQRIMIAMALLLNPSLIIADEATSALDVTLQAQILELFRQVRDTLGTSILLVSHDLGVVAETCDRVAVMYAGRVVETSKAASLFAEPLHPYTRALIATSPSYEERDRVLSGIPGRVPSLSEMPTGCAYVTRCPHATVVCAEPPPFVALGDRRVRCVIYDDSPGTGDDAKELLHIEQAPASPTVDPPTVGDGVPLVSVRGLTKHFEARQTIVDRVRRVPTEAIRAVDDIDLDLQRGEILGLVGESGSGKTTLALSLIRLIEPTAGDITFDGTDLMAVNSRDLRRLRSRVQMIMQDSVGSLSPRMRIRDLLAEPYAINRIPMPDGRITELLDLVGLSADLADKLPYQLSGGQARRVSIAWALALEPDLIVADEPTSGLDVSAAAGVLSLMKNLRDRLGVSYLIITHDLNIVGQVADRIAVMYLGQLVEKATTQQIFEDPSHPYTQGLLAAVPNLSRTVRETAVLPRGEMPSPKRPPSGCRFHTRCRLAIESCASQPPTLDSVDVHHQVACHLWPEARRTRDAPPSAL